MRPGLNRTSFLAGVALTILCGLAVASSGGAAVAQPGLTHLPHASSEIAATPAAARHSMERAPEMGATSAPAAAPVLSSAGQDPAAIGLNWTNSAGGNVFTNYSVQEASQLSGWNYSTVSVITSAASTTYVATGLSPGTDYDWQVVENSQNCGLLGCTSNSAVTNVLNLTQPTVAYLTATGVTSTSATLNWNNNATYGTLISFESYAVWEESNGGAPSQITSIATVSTTSYVVSLVAGSSYSFFVKTSDCISGCGGGSPVSTVSQSNLITIGTPQTLSVSVFAEHGTIDLGQSDFFTCTPTGGKSPFTYSWDFGNGTFVAGSASESVFLASIGILTVTCQVNDSEPSSASHAVPVQVNPPLQVTVTKSRTAADVGEPIAFSCTAVNGTTPYSLSWAFGDGSTTTVASPTYSYGAAGPYAPTCAVSDAAGAGMAPSTPIVISPALGAGAVASSLSAAPGTTLTFTAEPRNGSGSYTDYSWAFGAGATGTGAQVTHAFPSPQNLPVTVTITDSNGATATGSVTVDISAISVTVVPPSASITTGSTTTFSASASGGAGGPYNFTWTFGDGHVGYGATATHSYAKSGTENATLVVKDRLGASATTKLSPIHVSAAPGPFAWLTWWVALGISIAVALALVALLVSRRRRAAAVQLQKTASPYIPPTDPSETIFGSKTCEFCGSANLPIRTTCRSCGKPLPRSPT